MKVAAVRKIALSLPEVTEEPHHDFGSFRVRGKIFVTLPPGGELVHVFVPEPMREETVSAFPHFIETLHWGAKALGVRVRLAQADPGVVEALVRAAWNLKAPKSLARAGS